MYLLKEKVGFLKRIMSKETKTTCLYMGMGALIYEIFLGLMAIPSSIFMKYSLLPMELGILVGSLVVIGMVIDMGISTEDSLYGGNESYAQRKIIIHSLLRKVVLIIVIAIFWNSKYVNVLAIVVSIFGLKCGAYMYPMFKKIFEKRRKEEI